MPGKGPDRPQILTDCRLYRGAAPCAPHKVDGRPCEGCDAYDPIADHVLIVKLGALGDVLRTTALLPDILAQHPGAAVTWIARRESLPVLAGNPRIYRRLAPDEALPVLLTRSFAAVYVLDPDEDALALARLATADVHRGYRSGEHGTAIGVEPGGDDTLFRLGLSDDAKRANRRSYLELLLATTGLRWTGSRPTVTLSDDAVSAVRSEFGALDAPLIGVNAGASPRWQHKRWTPYHLAAFVARLHDEGMSAVLFGEGEDAIANHALAKRFGRRIHAFDSEGSTERLFAGIAQVDALVTTDTLAMHAAWALGRPVVALFGPTSAPEIDLDPQDARLTADLPCLGCYRERCDIERHCMHLLTPEIVFDALRARLAAREAVQRA